MSIALIAKEDVPVALVGKLLINDGAGPLYVFSEHEVLDEGKTVGDADLIFLISTTQDFLSAAGAVSRIHKDLSAEQELVLCITPYPHKDQRLRLLSCGADEVISPTGPEAGQIAERILSHAILRRRVKPYNLAEVLGATPVMRGI